MVSNEKRSTDGTSRYCIVGGGAAGIGIAKWLKAKKISFDLFEAEEDFGGNWYFGRPCSRVYQTTHLISSKKNTQFSDFPMPEDYPPYPDHRQMLSYLRNVASHFGLYENARFCTAVESMKPVGADWVVTLSDGETWRYRGVFIANGRLGKPVIPNYPGRFDGEVLHSADYKNANIFTGKRVLIIGAGNSGCDIAVDAATTASQTYHSMRRGYHFMPKFIQGLPTQEWLMENSRNFDSPKAFWRHVQQVFKLAGFDPVDFGLPAPDHEIDQAHPIMNSRVLYHIGHGDIVSKPDIETFDGSHVRFLDGTQAEIDLVLFATGYRISVPFIPETYLEWKGSWLDLFCYIFHRRYDNLFFLGYHNAPSGLGNVANAVGSCLVAYLDAFEKRSRAFEIFQKMKQGPFLDLGHGRFIKTDRHSYEVDLWKLIQALNFLRTKFEAA